MLPDRHFLDEWNPIWWKKPPKELTTVLPAAPHVRLLKQRHLPHPGPFTYHKAKAFILVFQKEGTGEHLGFPDLDPTWLWTSINTPIHTDITLPGVFQIDCKTELEDMVRATLHTPTKPILQLCQWQVEEMTRPGISDRTIFWGTPQPRLLQAEFDRYVYTQEIKRIMEGIPGTLVGDLKIRIAPEALTLNFTHTDALENLPPQATDNILLLSGKKALITTSTPATQWTTWLTEQKEADLENRITSLMWKTSTMGGQT